MRFKCPRGGRRYGVLATVVLFAMCGGGADSLPAQSKLLDKNKQAFPAAPAAGTGAKIRATDVVDEEWKTLKSAVANLVVDNELLRGRIRQMEEEKPFLRWRSKP